MGGSNSTEGGECGAWLFYKEARTLEILTSWRGIAVENYSGEDKSMADAGIELMIYKTAKVPM